MVSTEFVAIQHKYLYTSRNTSILFNTQETQNVKTKRNAQKVISYTNRTRSLYRQ